MKRDPSITPEGEAPTDRHARILDAAERCFVRSGFHRTTMQDIAAEAGMSPGNLYRYFRSKDAMVAGLTERDRADMAGDFAAIAEANDFMAVFRELGRKHFEQEPREKAILCLEIWAEATRNPAVAGLSIDFERDMVERMFVLFEHAKARGQIPAHVDSRAVAVIIGTIADGLFVRRAILPHFDARLEVDRLLALIGALLMGQVSLQVSLQEKIFDAETSS